MKKYLINYASLSHHESQKLNTHTGLTVGGFDEVIQYSEKDIDEVFALKNSSILAQPRGAGYWLWKPYIIYKTLNLLKPEDVLFYSDSGAYFIEEAHPLLELCLRSKSGVIPFHMEPLPTNKEVLQTKRDAFILTECDTDYYKDSWARLASFSVWRKTDISMRVLHDWLSYCQDERVLTDLPSQLGTEDTRYIAHRHDQSVFSLVTKKHDIQSFPDPSQWGNGYRYGFGYEQIINHTRNRS